MASAPHIFFKPPTFLSEQLEDESDVEDELEVDELDSDTDLEEQANASKPPKSKNGTARPGERVPGHTLLPPVRIENMLQAEGITGNLALSKEGLFVLSIATEEFIKRLIQAGHREASAHRRNQINYTDMAAATIQYQEFMLLSETIPAPVSLSEALMLRQQKERELLEDNPALAPSSFPDAVTSNVPTPEPDNGTISTSVKSLKKTKATNGKEKLNGSGSSSATQKRPAKRSARVDVLRGTRIYSPPPPRIDDNSWVHTSSDINGIVEHHRRSSRNGLSAASSMPPHDMNGHTGLSPSHSPINSRENSLEPAPLPPPSAQDPRSHPRSPPYNPVWQGQFTGPASGFLPGGVPPFASNQNPGRTIYSQTHRPD